MSSLNQASNVPSIVLLSNLRLGDRNRDKDEDGWMKIKVRFDMRENDEEFITQIC